MINKSEPQSANRKAFSIYSVSSLSNTPSRNLPNSFTNACEYLGEEVRNDYNLIPSPRSYSNSNSSEVNFIPLERKLSFIELIQKQFHNSYEVLTVGVEKWRIRRGQNIPDQGPIQPNSEALIKFDGRRLNGDSIDPKRDFNQTRNFRLGKPSNIAGLEIAILSMELNETALFKFSPPFHFFPPGRDLTFSSEIIFGDCLSLDKNEDAYFKVELLEYWNFKIPFGIDDLKTRICMIIERRAKAEYFIKSRNFKRAIKECNSALSIYKLLPKKQNVSEEMRKVLNSNLDIINKILETNGQLSSNDGDNRITTFQINKVEDNSKFLKAAGMYFLEKNDIVSALEAFDKCLKDKFEMSLYLQTEALRNQIQNSNKLHFDLQIHSNISETRSCL